MEIRWFWHRKKQICAQNVIFGCFLLWMIFRIAFLSFLDVIWSQNGVPGKNNFQTFASILEVKIVFLRPPSFLSILLSKISTKCSNSNLITWKSHGICSKCDRNSYARLANLPDIDVDVDADIDIDILIDIDMNVDIDIKHLISGRAVSRLCRYKFGNFPALPAWFRIFFIIN